MLGSHELPGGAEWVADSEWQCQFL
jgi:hypothetical protein